MPAEAYIETGSDRVPMQPLENHSFQYTFKNVTEAVQFRIYAAGFYSASNTLKVVLRPVLKAFHISINYPSYTGKKDEIRSSLSDMTLPVGTKVAWSFVTDHTDGATIGFGGGVPVNMEKNGAGYSYQWQNGSVNIPGATSSAYSVTIAGSFKAVITSNFGCITVSSAVAVTVDPSLLITPSVTISAMPGNILCLVPSPVSFSATPVNGGSAPTYQWFVNGAGAGMGATFGYTPANGDIVKLLMTSNAACVSPLTASHTDTMIISPMETPSVTISASPAEICSGNIITFTAHPVYGGTEPVYHWSRNDTNVATGYGYVYMPHYGDVLKVILYSNYPCLLRDTALSPQILLHPINPVLNTVSVSVTQSALVAGNADTFIALAPNGGSAPAYQWLLNGSPVAGATGSIYVTSTLTAGEVISCEETSNKPCATPETAVSGGITVRVIPVGVQQLTNNGTQFTLLPNPNNGLFTIEGSLKDNTSGHVNIMITDMLGRNVYKNVFELQNGNLNQQIVLGCQVASGIYMVNITSGEEHFVFRIVVDK